MKGRRFTEALEKAIAANAELSEVLDQALKSHDPFLSCLADARRRFHYACDHSRKSEKDIEQAVLTTWQLAQMRGYKGDYREWEKILRADSVSAWRAAGEVP